MIGLKLIIKETIIKHEVDSSVSSRNGGRGLWILTIYYGWLLGIMNAPMRKGIYGRGVEVKVIR